MTSVTGTKRTFSIKHVMSYCKSDIAVRDEGAGQSRRPSHLPYDPRPTQPDKLEGAKLSNSLSSPDRLTPIASPSRGIQLCVLRSP